MNVLVQINSTPVQLTRPRVPSSMHLLKYSIYFCTNNFLQYEVSVTRPDLSFVLFFVRSLCFGFLDALSFPMLCCDQCCY